MGQKARLVKLGIIITILKYLQEEQKQGTATLATATFPSAHTTLHSTQPDKATLISTQYLSGTPSIRDKTDTPRYTG